MELVFSWVLLIGIPICLVLIFIKFKKRVAYKEGKKVANTGFLENTDLYRRLERQYKIYVRAAFVSMIAAIFVGFLLIARPAKIDRISPEIRNRDIFLCMDTSDIHVGLSGRSVQNMSLLILYRLPLIRIARLIADCYGGV